MDPQTIFINTINTVYTANYLNGIVQIWLEGSTSPTDTIVTNASNPYALFVSELGDVYVDNGYPNNHVDVWRENANSSFSSLSIGKHCYSLFMIDNDFLYCSMHESHQVIKRSLNDSDNQLTIVAGTGCAGYGPHLLFYPRGIFVTINLDLYVADTDNHRVQLYRAGQLNGTVIVGTGKVAGMPLRNPAAVMLDADEYLFILDSNNVRIIRSGPDGFRCVIGCVDSWGSQPHQFVKPRSMAFDSHGNIFVVDTENHRVQKFLLSPDSCSKFNKPGLVTG